jgi:hypothetical protein
MNAEVIPSLTNVILTMKSDGSVGAESSVENMESLAEFQREQPLSKKNESTGQLLLCTAC